MSFELIQANANNLPLQDNTVDLIITSPPYFALRSYRDDGEHYDDQIGSEATPTQFLDALIECTQEMKRVLKPTGSIFVNLGDKYAGSSGANNNGSTGTLNTKKDDTGNKLPVVKDRTQATWTPADTTGFRAKSLMGLPWRYAIRCIDELGLILRSEIIWHKPNGLPESVTDRTRRNHEQWFHMVKEPRYYTSIDHIREPHTSYAGFAGHAKQYGDQRNDDGRRGIDNENALGRLPGSVWTIPTEPLTNIPPHLPQHYAAFPQEWPRKLTLAFSPTGICTKCGQGRRPTTIKDATGRAENTATWESEYQYHEGTINRTLNKRPDFQRDVQTTITGEECDCPTPSAPTTPSIVLDPFCGTGTTIGVAHTLGRHAIGIDLSRDYLRLAEWRITQSGHFEKSYQRSAREGAELPLTPPPTPHAGQESLL